MESNTIEKRAFQYFDSGFHCAEAMYVSIMEQFSDESAPIDPKAASAFCGGIGKSKQETCGALTGGVLALGQLFGRSQPKEPFDHAWQLAALYREQFVDCFQASTCSGLLDRFGDQENMLKCKHLTGQAARILFQIISDRLLAATNQNVEEETS